MASTIKIKRSAEQGKIPLTTNLELGELAINTYDGKLFLKRNTGLSESVVEVGGNVGFEVKNQTGNTLTKGTVVRFTGTLGASGQLLVDKFLANGTYPSEYVVGIVEQDIPNGGDGFVIDHGKIRGIDTSAWAAGTILYASNTVAGELTATRPAAPNNKVTIAAVVNSSVNNGTLEVRVTLGSQLSNDELVELTNLQNNDIIKYNSTTGRFENTQPTSELDTLDSVTDRGATTTNAITVGTIQHSGLVVTEGTNLDQIKTITKSITLTTDWQDTGIKGTDLATGTYIVQLYANDTGAGGTNSNEYYSGTMSWYSGDTNSSVELPTDEIVLHRAGGSGEGGLYLRTYRTPSASGDDLKLQIFANQANASASNYVFKFRRMI
jgi:hypothetical protein